MRGYDARSAHVSEAETLLFTEKFDLIILSAFLSQSEVDRILAAAGETPTLVLRGLTLAPELLGKVERMLAELEASKNDTARDSTELIQTTRRVCDGGTSGAEAVPRAYGATTRWRSKWRAIAFTLSSARSAYAMVAAWS
jgi:hypothetical protein